MDVQGDILPGDNGYNGLTFYDRGPGSTPIGCHNATGTTYVGLTDSSLGIPVFPCAIAPTTAPKMPVSTQWAGTPYGGSIGVGSGATIGMPRTDGFVDGFNTIQGIRSFDSTSGLWITYDVHPGELSDPASQKSYMWNGNDPLNNFDPAGTILQHSQPISTPSPPPPPSSDIFLIWGGDKESTNNRCGESCVQSVAVLVPCHARACMMAPQTGEAKAKCEEARKEYKQAGGDLRQLFTAISPKMTDIRTTYTNPEPLSDRDERIAARIEGASNLLMFIYDMVDIIRSPQTMANVNRALDNVERDCTISVPSP